MSEKAKPPFVWRQGVLMALFLLDLSLFSVAQMSRSVTDRDMTLCPYSFVLLKTPSRNISRACASSSSALISWTS